MTRTLIIGYGNDLRGDDALGPIAARILMDRFDGNDKVRIETCQGLTPDLSLPISEADRVIFIDCAAEGPVGQLIRRVVEPRDDMEMSMVHFLDPEALLAWTVQLYGKRPHAEVFSVPGASFDIRETLTDPVAAVLPDLIEQVVCCA